MFYKFYRLKQKKGAVLMLVVVVMSLLVIVASTAYYTARSAYKTVVSNYDFSQLYLSATSVSDMMLDAVANDTSESSVNNFDGLKSAVLALSELGSYIDLSDKATSSVKDGVLDGVSVRITLSGIEDVLDSKGKDTNLDRYIYTFETTAEYRANTVKVQDIIYNERGIKNNPPQFDTFFTATGQELTVDGDGNSSIKDSIARKVLINTKEITDDAFFENEVTIFPSGSCGNEFKGGLTSSGSVYIHTFNSGNVAAPTYDLDDFAAGETTKTGTRNDWFIAKDLVFINENANNFDINGNNLYVGGNLIIFNAKTYSAGNIYVMGDVYLFNQSTIDANLYVNGQVKTIDDAGIINKVVAECGSETGFGGYNAQNFYNNASTASYDGTGNIMYQTNPATELGKVYGGNRYVFGGNTGNATEIAAYKYGDVQVKQWLDPLKTPVVEASLIETDDKSAYDYEIKLTTLGEALSGKTEKSDYGSYTSDAEKVLKNELVIDVSVYDKNWNFNPFPGHTTFTDAGDGKNYYATFTSTKGDVANVHVLREGNGSVTIDLPYSAVGGYALTLIGVESYSNAITYNVESGAKSMTIVLKANFADNSAITDEDVANDSTLKKNVDINGYNAFSWKGGSNGWGGFAYDNGNGPCKVQVIPNKTTSFLGNVVFELGNYTPATGLYCAYDATKSSAIDTVVYYMAQKETVGTVDQVAKIGENWQSPDILKTMVDANGKPIVKDGVDYNNRIVFISNKNDGVAINGERQNNTFCGYFYAPNGVYANNAASNSTAQIFGGMIVSTYKLGMGTYIYAEPIPSMIEEAFSSLVSSNVGNNLKLDSGIWYNSGSNYLG